MDKIRGKRVFMDGVAKETALPIDLNDELWMLWNKVDCMMIIQNGNGNWINEAKNEQWAQVIQTYFVCKRVNDHLVSRPRNESMHSILAAQLNWCANAVEPSNMQIDFIWRTIAWNQCKRTFKLEIGTSESQNGLWKWTLQVNTNDALQIVQSSWNERSFASVSKIEIIYFSLFLLSSVQCQRENWIRSNDDYF